MLSKTVVFLLLSIAIAASLVIQDSSSDNVIPPEDVEKMQEIINVIVADQNNPQLNQYLEQNDLISADLSYFLHRRILELLTESLKEEEEEIVKQMQNIAPDDRLKIINNLEVLYLIQPIKPDSSEFLNGDRLKAVDEQMEQNPDSENANQEDKPDKAFGSVFWSDIALVLANEIINYLSNRG